MIKSVKIFNDRNESIELVLAQPELSGFVVESIDGLGPVKATINKNELALSDGSVFNSARLADRNIVMKLQFYNTTESIEDIRQKSYKYFQPKTEIKFQVFTDNRSLEISGYVESNEPSIFSKKEGAQISIICPDPYFRSQYINTTTFYGITSAFEFEFENESLTEPTIEFGEINLNQEQTIYYTGDVEVGVIIYIHATGEVDGISIYNETTREIMRINTSIIEDLTGQALDDGDDIIINTTRGNKSIQLFRSGSYINILNCLGRDTNWFKLRKGDNVFTYTADSGVYNMTFEIENQILYEGV